MFKKIEIFKTVKYINLISSHLCVKVYILLKNAEAHKSVSKIFIYSIKKVYAKRFKFNINLILIKI